MSAASAHRDFFDGRLAQATWFAPSIVDHKIVLMMPAFAVGILIIPKRRPSVGYALGYDRVYRIMKSADLLLGQFVGGTGGIDFCSKESLVGLDVAHAANGLLLKNELFYLDVSFCAMLRQIIDGKLSGQRFSSHLAKSLHAVAFPVF